MSVQQIDPYKVLGLSKNFTLEQLKSAYKNAAFKTHPDKGGNEYLFKVVTNCYKHLHKIFKNSQMEKQHQELRNNSREFIQNQKENPYMMNQLDISDMNFEKISMKKFNKLFEKNRIEDVYDQGYGNMMEKHTDTRDDIGVQKIIQGNTFNNDAFDNHTSKNKHREIIKYKEPQGLISNKKLGYTELGIKRVDDFSGENVSNKDLNFMDYMKAHTTDRLFNPEEIKQRQEYKNLDELERDRSTINYVMDEKTLRKYHKQQLKDKKREDIRQQTLKNNDDIISQKYMKNHYKILNSLKN